MIKHTPELRWECPKFQKRKNDSHRARAGAVSGKTLLLEDYMYKKCLLLVLPVHVIKKWGGAMEESYHCQPKGRCTAVGQVHATKKSSSRTISHRFFWLHNK